MQITITISVKYIKDIIAKFHQINIMKVICYEEGKNRQESNITGRREQ